MEIKLTNVCFLFRKQTFMVITKAFIFFCFTTIFALTPQNVFSPNSEITIEENNTLTVEEVFNQIMNQTEYIFVYEEGIFKNFPKVSVKKGVINTNKLLSISLSKANLNIQVTSNNAILIEENPLFIGINANEQSVEITGTVTDTNNQPLSGANIIEKGTKNGTQSDFDGKFTLKLASQNATIVVSYLGFVTQEVTLNNQTKVTIELVEDADALDEVVVIGYGSLKKSDLTGAISQVKREELNTLSASNPLQALQGKAPGVSVFNGDASPGSEPTIRIRGTGSISAGNSPLIVVDGFPLVNANINDISTADIESMEILKDASSAAIYGSRGANGVILITTRNGKIGQNQLEVLGSSGLTTPTRIPEMLGRTDFINFINEAYTYQNGNPVYSSSNPAPYYYTDWQDEIINNVAQTQNYSISFSGGNDKTTYMLSGNLYDEEGLVDAAGFKKLTVRTNLNHEYKPWLTVGTHLQVGRIEREIRNNAIEDSFRYGWTTTPVKNDDGSWYYATSDPAISSYFENPWNPVADASEVTNTDSRDRVLGDLYAIFKPIKNVTFKTNFGVDIANTKSYGYSTSLSTSGINSGNTGSGSQRYTRKTSQLTENVLTYSNTWSKHSLTATGVYSWQKYLEENLGFGGSGFENDATGANEVSHATRDSWNPSSDKFSSKLISWTARAVYSYDSKYLFTATGRYDGSSRFGENNKWGFFPSVGLGWNIDKESFLQDSEVFTAMKLRTSYGVTGNQEIGNYQSLSRLESVYYSYAGTQIPGFTETIGNQNLKWERNIQYNVGLDISLWRRLDLSLDYYIRKTTDLLYNVPIPTSSGYNSVLQNIGEVENSGLEITANLNIVDSSDFKWDITGNVSNNKNKIVQLYGDVDRINVSNSTAGISSFLIVGEPVNSLWARESAGIIQTQEQLTAYQSIRSSAQLGEEMYVDQDGNGSINTDDYINIGTTTPNVFYGISTNLSYKKLSLDIYGQGASGIAVGDSYFLYGENQAQNRNYLPTKYAYDRMWSPTNASGTFPRAGAKDVYFSDRTNGNLHNFIVRNIKLGYEFSSIFRNEDWINQLNVYINAQNFINSANHRGYNPENANVSIPYGKTLILGFTAKF